MKGTIGYPKLFWNGYVGEQVAMIMELLGKDLKFYMKNIKTFSLESGMTLMG
jgi:serine/threonine protein kinase